MKVVSYLGIGSNLGDRKKNINEAIKLLRKSNIKVDKMSRIIETDPVGGPRQPKFLNAALKIQTELNPFQLLILLKGIERKMGRRRTVRNGPRPIDIDILLYADKIIKSERLQIPHPRMLERDFVKEPLFEIAPNAIREFLECRLL